MIEKNGENDYNNNNNKRGVIVNRQLGSQIKDYSGLRHDKITPTDIDGIIEYKDFAYLIIELKYPNVALPKGQEICLERLIRDLQTIKPQSILIIGEHHTPKEDDIDVSGADITKVYTHKGIITRCNEYTLGVIVHKWYDHCDKLINNANSRRTAIVN